SGPRGGCGRRQRLAGAGARQPGAREAGSIAVLQAAQEVDFFYLSIRSCSRTESADRIALPDGGVERVPAVVTLAFIESDSAGVGFGYSQGHFTHTLPQKRRSSHAQKHATQTPAAITRPHAEWRDVPADSAYARAQDQADNVTCGAFQHDVRDMRREHS